MLQDYTTILDQALREYDTPLDVVIVCFPNEKEPRALMSKFARQIYGYYVHDVYSMELIEARELASKKSHKSTLELDIMIKALIEQSFKNEVEEMYNISLDIITASSPYKIHQLVKDLTIVEEAYVQTKPEDLSDSTLYKNQRYSENNLRVNTNSMYSL